RIGFRIAARVGRARRLATGVPEEWSSPSLMRVQNPAYRPSDASFAQSRRASSPLYLSLREMKKGFFPQHLRASSCVGSTDFVVCSLLVLLCRLSIRPMISHQIPHCIWVVSLIRHAGSGNGLGHRGDVFRHLCP